MLYKKHLTAFLGGVIGTLIVGFAYYYTGRQYAWLVPLGTLVGCSIGYFLANIKNIIRKAEAIKAPKINWEPEKKKLAQMEAFFNALPKRVQSAIGRFLWALARPLIGHPVNRALWIEFLVSLIVAAGFLFLPSRLLGSEYDIFPDRMIGNKTLGYLMGILILYVFTFNRFREVFQDKSCFVSVWKKWRRSKLQFIALAFLWSVLRIIVPVLLAFGIWGFVVLPTVLCLLPAGVVWLATIVCSSMVFGYVKALKNYQNLLTFAITLFWVAMAYIFEHKLFSDPVLIWITALATGALASFTTSIALRYLPRKGFAFAHPRRFIVLRQGAASKTFAAAKKSFELKLDAFLVRHRITQADIQPFLRKWVIGF